MKAAEPLGNTKPLWNIRGVQLDLARQMETIDYIKYFIDFISKYGFNMLVLYLEGRIKTKTFPYPQDEQSYTPEDIKTIVSYADSKGIDIMPVIPNLGHMEQFLCYDELKHLAELRGKKAGRFTSEGSEFYRVICPSLDETYEFYEAYLKEVAPLFPGIYFHTGNDESWDMGYCDLCRRRLEQGETQSGIFAEHLVKTNEIIKSLGKKMVIWEDMFEHYPEALNKIPRDIVLCCWHYNNLIDIPEGHFANKLRINKFELYDNLGFEYLFATGTSVSNIQTFTQYALRNNAIGGIATIWEKKFSFMLEHYFNIAFAGRLWENGETGKAESIYRKVISEVIGCNDNRLINILYVLQNILLERLKPKFTSQIETTTFKQYEHSIIVKYLIDCLKEINCSNSGIYIDIYNDMIVRLEEDILAGKIRTIIKKLFEDINKNTNKVMNEDINENINKNTNNGNGFISMQINECIAKVDEIYNKKKNTWNKYRNGLSSEEIDKYYMNIIKNLKLLLDISEGRDNLNTGILKVSYFLPDAYASQRVRIYIQCEQSAKWVKVAEGVYKPLDISYGSHAYYTISYPINTFGNITKCKIETWGHGGQGFSYIEAVNKTGHYIPYAISEATGKVDNPENILINDSQWCYTGERNVNYAFNNMGVAEAKNSLVIDFIVKSDI